METKFTKGTWLKKEANNDSIVITTNSDQGDIVGKRLIIGRLYFETAWQDPYVSGMGRSQSEVRHTQEEAEANANLIIAAPEMIIKLNESNEMLKSVLSLYEDYLSTIDRYSLTQQIKENEELIERATA